MDKWEKIANYTAIAAVVFMFVIAFGAITYASIDDAYMHGVCKAKGGFYIHTGLCLDKNAIIDLE